MRLAVLLCLALAALPALAALAAPGDKPPVAPQRDVDVVYRIAQRDPDGPPLTQRLRWSVAQGKLRVDPPSPGLYMIIDTRSRRMMIVKDADRAVLDVDTAGPGLPGAAATGAAFVRGEADTVAGLPCTEWATTDAGNQPVVLCLTADGVMLRARRGTAVLTQAERVTFAAPDPAVFVPPPGFRHTEAGRP